MIGIDDAVAAVGGILGKVIDRAWPDPTEKAKAVLALAQLQQTGELTKLTAESELIKGQLAINLADAQSGKWYQSGWRPACGWMGAIALGYMFFIRPILCACGVVAPPIDTTVLLSVLGGMLGIRTVEKIRGVA